MPWSIRTPEGWEFEVDQIRFTPGIVQLQNSDEAADLLIVREFTAEWVDDD